MCKLDPKHYDKNSTFQKTVATEVMDLFPVNSTDKILDVGCGDGYLSAILADIAIHGTVTGIDPSEEMINYANATYVSNKYKNLQFEIGKAESYHGDKLYTVVTAFNCLHWSHNLTIACKSCFNALKKGGRFMGVTYPAESIYWSIFVNILSQTRWQKYLSLSPISSWLSSDKFRQLAANNDFEILFFETYDCVASYSTRQELSDYITGWLSCLLPIGEYEQRAFLMEVLDLAERQFKNEISIDIPYTKLTFCFAKK